MLQKAPKGAAILTEKYPFPVGKINKVNNEHTNPVGVRIQNQQLRYVYCGCSNVFVVDFDQVFAP